MKNNKGFTLIELLVVIAIIGILAAIVMASLGESRIRAKDAVIVSGMNQLATAVELETDATGNYTDVCDLFDPGGNLENIKTSVEDNGGIWESCESDVTSYAVVVTLNAQQAYNPFGVEVVYARANVTLCHAPGTAEQETIYTEGSNTDYHRSHGDTEGECGPLSSGTFTGVHSDDGLLLSTDDIKALRDDAKANGQTFIEPKYYCVGAAPANTGVRKGYLYAIPQGGCGSPAPSFSDAQTAYSNRE